jgi:hypothetical protein
MITRIPKKISTSNQDALAAFVRKKAVSWGHVGTLGYYAELLKRVTDSAFHEGEHAA